MRTRSMIDSLACVPTADKSESIILRFSLPERHEQIIQLTKWLPPTAADWGRRHSRFYDVYDDALASLFRS